MCRARDISELSLECGRFAVDVDRRFELEEHVLLVPVYFRLESKQTERVVLYRSRHCIQGDENLERRSVITNCTVLSPHLAARLTSMTDLPTRYCAKSEARRGPVSAMETTDASRWVGVSRWKTSTSWKQGRLAFIGPKNVVLSAHPGILLNFRHVSQIGRISICKA